MDGQLEVSDIVLSLFIGAVVVVISISAFNLISYNSEDFCKEVGFEGVNEIDGTWYCYRDNCGTLELEPIIVIKRGTYYLVNESAGVDPCGC